MMASDFAISRYFKYYLHYHFKVTPILCFFYGHQIPIPPSDTLIMTFSSVVFKSHFKPLNQCNYVVSKETPVETAVLMQLKLLKEL